MSAKRIRIRMYRVGFGDCFLVTLPRGNSEAHLLIDCGVHSQGNIGTMDDVVADIAEVTGGRLSAVVATHEHQDHISGFALSASRFAGIHVEETWLPWTSDPRDPQARRIRRKQAALAATLNTALAGLRGSRARAVQGIALNAMSNARAMETLRSGFANQPKIRYLAAGGRLQAPARITGLDVRVLGPPRDERSLSRMDPPKAQRYLRLGSTLLNTSLTPTMGPFPRVRSAGIEEGASARLTESEREHLRKMVTVDAGELAFALDRAVNNTSLVLLLRFGGRSLLFPGDAQWGSWESWLGLADASEILENVDVIKISHHGSHDGTPRDAVERLSDFHALASTQSTPWPSIPRLTLLDALEKRKGTVLRSDWIPVGKVRGPKPRWKRPPRGVSQGKFWFDLHLGMK